jgi:pimeloyl-ACP methyl ester carboxylesterase
MDLIRASMGFEKLHYLGISYGTYLGGVYATLFPDRVESMFLDSAFDPQGDTLEQEYLTQAIGFEKAFKNWVTWCEDNSETCAFNSGDVKQSWLDLYDALDKVSLAVDKRDVNHAVINEATKFALYSKSRWSQLASALASAQDGNGVALLALADESNGRGDDGKYSSQTDAFYVIRCASGMGRPTPEDPAALAKKLTTAAPWYYRGLTADDLDGPDCEEGFGTPQLWEISHNGTAPIVVLGGKNDPATPFRWAEEMTASLGDNAHLVAFTGEGHGQVLSSECVNEVVAALFNKGVVPAKGKTCTPDVPLAKPVWWDDTVTVAGTPLDSEIFNYYFGLKTVKSYAEYMAIKGSVSDAFKAVSASLKSKGLRYAEGENLDPTSAPQWFLDGIDTDKFVGVWISSEQELKDNSMVEPDGIVPAGHLVVALYYYP